MHGEWDRLARSVRQRKGPVLAVVGQALTTQGRPDDVDVLPGPAERPVEPHAVPTLRHLRAGDAETQTEPTAGQAVECGGGHRGTGRRPGRGLHHGAADVD